MARAIKCAEEVKCVTSSLRATEAGVHKVREAIRPGMTENELWSVPHKFVIEQDGVYCETRLLSAGQRTNPWFKETSSHIIGKNELVALDTDVVGWHGYYSDFSRTFHTGTGKPTEEQKRLYTVAYEQFHHNMSILRPAFTFRESADYGLGYSGEILKESILSNQLMGAVCLASIFICIIMETFQVLIMMESVKLGWCYVWRVISAKK